MSPAMQVILAEDTYLQKSKVVVIKVMKRHFGSVGQKVKASVQRAALLAAGVFTAASCGTHVTLSSNVVSS